jgi:hypothetical protein
MSAADFLTPLNANIRDHVGNMPGFSCNSAGVAFSWSKAEHRLADQRHMMVVVLA